MSWQGTGLIVEGVMNQVGMGLTVKYQPTGYKPTGWTCKAHLYRHRHHHHHLVIEVICVAAEFYKDLI